MAEVKLFYDRDGQTLTVWFTDRSHSSPYSKFPWTPWNPCLACFRSQ
jgi:hypothetical protein